MEISANKNIKQINFNKIHGIIHEISDRSEPYPSITLMVGHENKRFVNFVFKAADYDKIVNNYDVGHKVTIHFYIASHYKNGRWYTSANVLSIDEYESSGFPE